MRTQGTPTTPDNDDEPMQVDQAALFDAGFYDRKGGPYCDLCGKATARPTWIHNDTTPLCAECLREVMTP